MHKRQIFDTLQYILKKIRSDDLILLCKHDITHNDPFPVFCILDTWNKIIYPFFHIPIQILTINSLFLGSETGLESMLSLSGQW